MLITGFMIYTGINLKSILEPTKTKYCVVISPVGYILYIVIMTVFKSIYNRNMTKI